MRSRRSWWLIYAACAAVVLAGLVWITATVVRLERAELAARTGSAHQESLRLALWRMDSWLAPLLAREAARPYFDYQPFSAPRRAYTALLDPIRPGEILTPSPLLSFESEYFTLHFQIDPEGRLTSPQVPVGDFRDLARGVYLAADRIAGNAARLEAIGTMVTPQQVATCVAQGAEGTAAPPASPPPLIMAQADDGLAEQLKTQQEAARRKGAYQKQVVEQAQAANAPGPAEITVGPLVPFWTAGGSLLFSRSVGVGGREYLQGFLCDWTTLQASLLAQISDLFADAGLVPVAPGDDETGTMLATIPVALEAPAAAPAAPGLLSPARSTLALTWLGVLAGLAAVAVTLRASIAFGERRSRFASAVTHELRTPLTTFRMYSEMLADGMVTDDDRRKVYLETLRDESGRLAGLVENVLAYARLEEGRGPADPRPTTLGAVLSSVAGHLEKRAAAAGVELRVDNAAPAETPLVVDTDAVGQILLNLVDNACKYAANGTVHVDVAAADGRVTIRVRDHGPGIPAAMADAVFKPFDRGARNTGDATPGVGLGLALARGLARDVGGDLVLDTTVEDGACFELRL